MLTMSKSSALVARISIPASGRTAFWLVSPTTSVSRLLRLRRLLTHLLLHLRRRLRRLLRLRYARLDRTLCSSNGITWTSHLMPLPFWLPQSLLLALAGVRTGYFAVPPHTRVGRPTTFHCPTDPRMRI